jgi:hypothetical protein
MSSASSAGRLKCVQRADVVKLSGTQEGTGVDWACVGIRSVKKQNWQDLAGVWRDSVHFYEIAPADEESRIELDEYFVEGQFRVVRQVTDAQLALAEWHAFEPK